MSDESQQLWQTIITPLLQTFAAHTTMDQLAKLRDEALHESETPPAVFDVIDTLVQLRTKIDQL